jgi:hypothetical protein
VSFFGAALDKKEMYTHIFTCKKGDFPFRYLGIPMHFKRLLNSDWKDVEDRIEKKNACWKGNITSIGSRLILLEASLSSITSYMMSFFTMPKGVLKRCDFFRARMLWQEKVNVKKYHLVKWSDVCQPKDQGGLGVTDLHLKNVSLLCKWIWRLENEEGLWQDLIKAKYLKKCTFSQCKPSPSHSHFWSGLVAIKDIFYSCCKRVLGDGRKTLFWEDSWVEHQPLCRSFPRLYNLCFSHFITVHTVFSKGFDMLKFRRFLREETKVMWCKLLDVCSQVQLKDEPDRVSWLLTKSGTFSVKSMYSFLVAKKVNFPYKTMWTLKLPLRIKVFLLVGS